MTKRTSRSKRKNERQRAGRAKDHGLPAKKLEEPRAKSAARGESQKRRAKDDEDDERDERVSDAGDDDDAPRSRKAKAPPISQNMIFIGAGIIVALGIIAYMASRNPAQPQRVAPEPGSGDTPAVTLTLPPSLPGSGRTLEPPVMLDEPPGEADEEKEKEAPPEKEKEEEKEKEKPTTVAPKPPPKLGEPPKAPKPKPAAAPTLAPKPAAPKATGDNPY